FVLFLVRSMSVWVVGSFECLATAERMRQRAAVDEFEFAAERNAVREPARTHARRTCQAREQVRGRLAFDGRVGRDDEFADFTFAEARGQEIEAEFLRPESIQRRQAP